MSSGQILIVSDDADFVRAISARWRKEEDSPSITAVSTTVSGQANPSGYLLVVVGPLRGGAALPQPPALNLDSTVCAVGDLGSLESVRARHPYWLLPPGCAGGSEALLAVVREG